MPVNVYLNFNGNCREAAEFYADVFKTEQPKIMTFGESMHDSDFPLPEEAKNLVMHTELTIGGSLVMFSDTFPGMPFAVGNNVNLAFLSSDKAEIQNAFDRLKEGGSVGMEMQETFWSKYYGMVTDKYGVIWQLNLNA